MLEIVASLQRTAVLRRQHRDGAAPDRDALAAVSASAVNSLVGPVAAESHTLRLFSAVRTRASRRVRPIEVVLHSVPPLVSTGLRGSIPRVLQLARHTQRLVPIGRRLRADPTSPRRPFGRCRICLVGGRHWTIGPFARKPWRWRSSLAVRARVEEVLASFDGRSPALDALFAESRRLAAVCRNERFDRDLARLCCRVNIRAFSCDRRASRSRRICGGICGTSWSRDGHVGQVAVRTGLNRRGRYCQSML